MARFDLYLNSNGKGYLLDVQSELHSHFNTRIVVPLLPVNSAPLPAKILNPIFDLDNTAHVVMTQYLAAVPLKTLKYPVLNLSEQHVEIVSALDMLFQGF